MTTNLEVPTSTTLALNAQWLEPTATSGTLTTNAMVGNTATYYHGYWPSGTYWYTYPAPDHRPIKLGLSEVEKLRSAAKRDAKLKKILEKFTDQIEVVVDFK